MRRRGGMRRAHNRSPVFSNAPSRQHAAAHEEGRESAGQPQTQREVRCYAGRISWVHGSKILPGP